MSFYVRPEVQTTGRSVWIDAVRGVAICLVIIGHTVQFGNHDAFDIFTNPVFVSIYAFHMPLFALISGYLGLPSVNKYSPISLLHKRARGLLIPFATWTLLGIGVLTLLRQFDREQFDVGELLAEVTRAFLLPESSLWFLWVMFCCYVVAIVLVKLLPTRKWIAGGILIVPLIWWIPLDAPFAASQLKWLFPFFLAGMVLRNSSSWLRRWEQLGTVIAVATFIGLLPFWQRDDSVYVSRMRIEGMSGADVAVAYGYRYAIALAGSVAVIGCVRLAARRISVAWLSSLGVASLGVYAVQTFPVTALRVLPSPAGNPTLYFGFFVPMVSTIVLAFSYVVVTRLLQPIRPLRVLFLGERS